MKSFILFLIIYSISNNISTAAQNQKNAVKENPAAMAAADTAERKSSGAVKGVVLDKTTKKPLAGVNVIAGGTRQGTRTNQDGAFIISKIAGGKYTLIFEHVGYAGKKYDNITILPGKTAEMQIIEMEEQPISLKEIVVTPGQFSIMGTAPLSRQTLSTRDIQNMSWAEDITRAVARLPGISSNDFSSKFTVRGGESDEVLITLDGMELYEPFHQRDYSGGLFSIVDIETIQGIELNTGGFSAEYGNRLSGVFNMRTKNVQEGQRHTSVGLSILNARLYTDGSFGEGKGSYIFSARRGMLDVLFKAAPFAEKATIDQSATPTFYDLTTKVDYRLSPKNLLSFHGLQAGDKTGVDDVYDGNFDRNDTRYGNAYGWLTLNSTYSPHLSSRTILYSGFITHDRNGAFHKYEPGDKGDFQLTDQRDYSLFGVKQDWSWEASNSLFFSSGFDAKRLKANYKYFSHLQEVRVNSAGELYDHNMTRNIRINPSGQQVGLYLTNRFKVLPKLAMETGLRYDYTSYTRDNLWSPRVGLAYAFSENTFLRGAWGYYYQTPFINNLDINHGNLTFDPAELARHYVAGFEHLFANGINFRLEGYYKDLSNYSPLWQNLRDHLEVFPEARNDNARVVLNGATSKGIELFLKYDNDGKISWWLSYALARAVDDIKAIEFDGLLTKRTGNVPRLNDQRHTLYADVNYRPNNKWHYNLAFQYYRGWPRTDYIFNVQALSNGDLHFYPAHQEFNGVVYPAYHRLDLRINRRFKTGPGTLTAFLHLINLYNRKNLKKFDLDATNAEGALSLDARGNYVPSRDDKYWFGFIPVIGTSWQF